MPKPNCYCPLCKSIRFIERYSIGPKKFSQIITDPQQLIPIDLAEAERRIAIYFNTRDNNNV